MIRGGTIISASFASLLVLPTICAPRIYIQFDTRLGQCSVRHCSLRVKLTRGTERSCATHKLSNWSRFWKGYCIYQEHRAKSGQRQYVSPGNKWNVGDEYSEPPCTVHRRFIHAHSPPAQVPPRSFPCHPWKMKRGDKRLYSDTSSTTSLCTSSS